MTSSVQAAAPSIGAAYMAHRGLNALVLIGVPIQVYLAGAVMFGAASLMPHRAAGFLLLILALLSALCGAAARRPGGEWRLAAVLVGLMVLQPVFVQVLRGMPAVASLHAANAMAIFAVAAAIELRLRSRGAR